MANTLTEAIANRRKESEPGSLPNSPEAAAARERMAAALDDAEDVTADEIPTAPPLPKAARNSGRQSQLATQLTKTYVTIGMTLLPFDNQCGTTVITNAESMANSLDELAKTNPAVKRALQKMVETSGWGLVIAAHAPVVMALATHHVLPAVAQSRKPKAPKASTEYVAPHPDYYEDPPKEYTTETPPKYVPPPQPETMPDDQS